MSKQENIDYGSCEDLAADLEFKLSDMFTFIKLVSNSTCQGVDFDIDANDLNKIALTMHDKIIAAMLVLQKLQYAIDKSQNL